MSGPIFNEESFFFSQGSIKFTAWPTPLVDPLSEPIEDGPFAILPTETHETLSGDL